MYANCTMQGGDQILGGGRFSLWRFNLGDGSGGAAKNNSSDGLLQERKVFCVSSKGGYKMSQRKFTASRWKPVHVSDGVADGMLWHTLFENQVQSFSGTQRTDSQPARQDCLREDRPTTAALFRGEILIPEEMTQVHIKLITRCLFVLLC